MATQDSETETDIKDTGIRTAVATPSLMATIEMVFHPLRLWKSAGQLGDEMIARILDYHPDLLRRRTSLLTRMMVDDLIVLMAIALVLGI